MSPVHPNAPAGGRSPRDWLALELGFARGWSPALWSAAAVAAAVFFVLAVYQPFGTREARIEYKYVLLAGYGVISGLVVLVAHRMVERLRPAGARWTLAHVLGYCGLLVVLAATANYAFYCWAFSAPFRYAGLVYFFQLSMAISVVPVGMLLWLSTRRPITLPAPAIAAVVQPATAAPPSVRVLTGANKDETLALDIGDLILVKAADNYAEVVFMDENQSRTRLLRITLANLAEQLADTQMLRTHRSYLVNLDRVRACSGNAGGLQLRVEGVSETVPVSRAFVGDVRAALKQHESRCA